MGTAAAGADCLKKCIDKDGVSPDAMRSLIHAMQFHAASQSGISNEPRFSMSSTYSTGEAGFTLAFQSIVARLDSRPHP